MRLSKWLVTLIFLPTLIFAEPFDIVESIKPDVTVIKRKDAGDIYIVRSEWREAGPFFPYGPKLGETKPEESQELKKWDFSSWYRRHLLTMPKSGETIRIIVINPESDSIDHGLLNISVRDGAVKKLENAKYPRPKAVNELFKFGDGGMMHVGYSLLDTESVTGATSMNITTVKKGPVDQAAPFQIPTSYLAHENNFYGTFLDTKPENLESITYQEFLKRMSDKNGLKRAFLTLGMGLTEYPNQTKTLSLTAGITKLGEPSQTRCAEVECDSFGFPIAPKSIQEGNAAAKSAAIESKTATHPQEDPDSRENVNLNKPQ